MVLKVRFSSKDGAEAWKYFEDITDLTVSPSNANSYYFETETNRVKLVDKDNHDIDLTDCVDCMFDMISKDCAEAERMPISLVEFRDKKGDQFRLMCVFGTIYLMNNEGKTIDRF